MDKEQSLSMGQLQQKRIDDTNAAISLATGVASVCICSLIAVACVDYTAVQAALGLSHAIPGHIIGNGNVGACLRSLV